MEQRNGGLLTEAFAGELRHALDHAGYNGTAVRAALTAQGDGLSPRPEQIPPVLYLLDDSPLHDLIRLFLLDGTLSEERAAAALRPVAPEHAAAVGLLHRAPEGYASPFRLVPSGEDLFVIDPPARENAPDFVMGVTPSSTALAHLTVRAPATRALDLGTGCGYQAVLASAHSQHVVATDVNPRALSLARFNAALNGVQEVELRAGSLFEPVAGEQFDVVVSNPPFVISPDSTLLYRDAQHDGDALSRMIVEAVPEHLAEGGIAHVMVNWLHPESDWSGPLRRWVDARGCDAFLLRFSTDTPLSYAENWSRPFAASTREHAADLQRWMAYFDRLGAEAVSYGAVILRRRQGRNWTRADDVPRGPVAPAGEQVRRLLESTTRLVEDPSPLLDAVLVVNERHRLEQVLRRREGGYNVDRATIRLEEGLPFEAAVDAVTARLLASIDGRLRLSEVVAATAAAAGAETASLSDAALPIVRRMLEVGLLSWS